MHSLNPLPFIKEGMKFFKNGYNGEDGKILVEARNGSWFDNWGDGNGRWEIFKVS